MAQFITTMQVKIEAEKISDVDDLALSAAVWEYCEQNDVRVVSIEGFGVTEIEEL